MARVLILCDRAPDDPDWKGAYIWRMALALAESQHEVTVLTTADLALIDVSHPRLSLARPAPTFAVDRLAAWSRALLAWRPEVIHTFSLQAGPRWPSLSVWPYLDAALRLLPDIKRVVTVFDAADLASAPAWYRGARILTTFHADSSEAARARFGKSVEVCPVDDLADVAAEAAREFTPGAEADFSADRTTPSRLLIPAPVSEWTAPNRELALEKLARELDANSSAEVWINGGWGNLNLSERRANWVRLRGVADRVHLTDAWSLNHFAARLKGARLYLDPLDPKSWRVQLARRLAGENPAGADAPGSTANHFSRLYLT